MNYRQTITALLALATTLNPLNLLAQVPRDGSPPPQIVSIDDAVSFALARHPLFLRDSALVASRSASVRAAFGSFLPSISVRGNYLKYLNDVGTVTGGLELESSRPSTELTGGASANLEIFDGFARSAGYNAAGYERDAAALNVVAHQAEVAFEVRSAFLDVLKAESSAEVRRTELSTLRTQRDRMAERAKAGVALKLDVDAIDAEIAMAEYELLSSENSASLLKTSLASAMNFDPGRRIEISSGGVSIDLDRAQIDALIAEIGGLDGDASELIGGRADVASLRASLLAAEERVTVAEAGRYPTVGASVGVSHYRSGPIRQTTGTLGINFQYLLFDQFRTDEAIAAAEASLLNARLDLRQLELDISQNLMVVRRNLQGATSLLTAARSAVEAARRSRQSAIDRHEAGVGSYGDVLVATNRYVQARINAINAGYDWWKAYYDVARVTGRVYPVR